MTRLALLLTSFLLVASFGCTQKKEESISSPAEKSSSKKELIVGTDAAYAPFESENADRTLSGFDIEIIQAVAAKAGLKIQVVNTPWEGLFNQLDSGDRDILISAITINDERKKSMEFSEPYFEAVQLIAIPNKSTVSKFEDLKKLKVGVQIGTTGDTVVTQLLGRDSASVKRFEGTPLALQELINGGVDAVVADNGVINNFFANNPKNFKVLSDTSFSKESYGIAVKKGNTELLQKINSGLGQIKADGTYESIYKKYFGEKKN
ncbi:basic amino acid ABC transporter substrate-binding protein [Bdellovibrio sp.]|uniref:basic amino acid ABC transporter substrate-binding protein n=1 Tax=Bdellovibrio TaxID=958 RepID=UPI00322181DD